MTVQANGKKHKNIRKWNLGMRAGLACLILMCGAYQGKIFFFLNRKRETLFNVVGNLNTNETPESKLFLFLKCDENVSFFCKVFILEMHIETLAWKMQGLRFSS